MKKSLKFIIYSCVCGFLTFGAGSLVLAAVNPRTKLDAIAGSGGAGLQGSFSTLTGTVVVGVLGAASLVFLIMVFYAGLIWLLAQGDTTKIQKAKTLLIYSVLGLIIMFLAYSITYFMFNDVLFNKING